MADPKDPDGNVGSSETFNDSIDEMMNEDAEFYDDTGDDETTDVDGTGSGAGDDHTGGDNRGVEGAAEPSLPMAL